jgi:hypothetical protein
MSFVITATDRDYWRLSSQGFPAVRFADIIRNIVTRKGIPSGAFYTMLGNFELAASKILPLSLEGTDFRRSPHLLSPEDLIYLKLESEDPYVITTTETRVCKLRWYGILSDPVFVLLDCALRRHGFPAHEVIIWEGDLIEEIKRCLIGYEFVPFDSFMKWVKDVKKVA